MNMARRNSKKVKNGLKSILSTSLYFLCILFIAYVLVKYVVQRATVIGESMENTLYDGDQLLMDKISYNFTDVKRFDLVVFPQKGNRKVCLIKRVIGLPGESVRIDKAGNIYINEELLIETYGREIIKNPGNAVSGIWLGGDEYFVLGDNRNESLDSRFEEIGPVREKDILGKVFLRLLPMENMGVVK